MGSNARKLVAVLREGTDEPRHGALPRHREGLGAILDDVDVADLESEATHGYELGPAAEPENQAAVIGDDGVEDEAPHEKPIADGGRSNPCVFALAATRWPPGQRGRRRRLQL